MKKISKILILGGPGSGKTTLANKLAKIFGLPIINLDNKGIYKTTLQERAENADLIIFLEYPTYYLLFRVIKRYLSNFGKEKKELDGCKEQLTWSFLKYTLRFNSKKKSIYEILNRVKNIDDKLIILKKGRFDK